MTKLRKPILADGSALVGCIACWEKGWRRSMPVRPELRPLYPPHTGANSTGACVSSVPEESASVVGRISPSSAVCLTGVGSMSKRRRGGIAVDGWPVARPCGSNASCSLRRTWTAIRPTIEWATSGAQRCHMLHDRPNHLAQRWITYPAAACCRRPFPRSVSESPR